MTWIQTFTGRRFWPLAPRPQDVAIHDIGHALANLCRFTGHVRQFYSVAQHSVLVSRACAPEDALWGLLHDASEAYLSDVARPVKHHVLMAPYREAETRLMDAVMIRFGLPLAMPASVAEADMRMLVTERRDLMGPTEDGHDWGLTHAPYPAMIEPWTPALAESRFLQRFDELYGRGR